MTESQNKYAELENRIARLEHQTQIDTSTEQIAAEAMADKFEEIVYAALQEWFSVLTDNKLDIDGKTNQTLCDRYPTMEEFLRTWRKHFLQRQNQRPQECCRPPLDLSAILRRINETGKNSE
jgi:hypothetical protein